MSLPLLLCSALGPPSLSPLQPTPHGSNDCRGLGLLLAIVVCCCGGRSALARLVLAAVVWWVVSLLS